jgi:hypothetical protein
MREFERLSPITTIGTTYAAPGVDALCPTTRGLYPPYKSAETRRAGANPRGGLEIALPCTPLRRLHLVQVENQP